MTPSRLVFRESLPSLSRDPAQSFVLLYDRRAAKSLARFSRWRDRFEVSYALSAGEKLKDVHSFAHHIARLVPMTRDLPRDRTRIVALGGGSVGDFAGFTASVLKRGVRLVHYPSTWLAAIDSAHGGKTALNVGGLKNPIGTFHPASEVVLVRELLQSQPRSRARDAYGELAKIALIDGGAWVKRLSASTATEGDLLWEFLRPAIASKLRIVARDPQETSGARAVLNFGHTLGHALEAHHGLNHGEAVAQGLIFAIEWSAGRGVMDRGLADEALQWLASRFGIVSRVFELKPVPRGEFLRILSQDKKRDSDRSVRFIFLEEPGVPRAMSVSLAELAREAARQGWVRQGDR